MFLYCLLRLFKAGVAVLYWSPSYYSAANLSSAREGGGTSDAGRGPGGGGEDDPATKLVRFAVSRHLLDDADAADGWSEVIFFCRVIPVEELAHNCCVTPSPSAEHNPWVVLFYRYGSSVPGGESSSHFSAFFSGG